MTVVAVWCRHIGDNVIAIGGKLPWNVPSDVERFYEIVKGQNVVCGRKTYESLPNKTIEGCQIFVMTTDEEYEPEDKKHHHIITKQRDLADLEGDLYIAGGAEIYKLFLTGKEKLKPQIVVDCVYQGEIERIEGDKVDINDSIEVFGKGYRKISAEYERDDVSASIWVRKGEFVEQEVLKRIVLILEKSANMG